MAHRIVFHPQAERELIELYDFIEARAGSPRAATFISGIQDFCLGLSAFPQRGTARKEFSGIRIIGYKRSVSIAFSVKPDSVVILGIFYGGQNITPAVLSTRD
jgi:toxin ParE1/3/4